MHDYGIQLYFPFEDAFDFFKQMNVTLAPTLPQDTGDLRYVDFTTGAEVTNYRVPGAGAGIAAIQRFHDLMIEKGYDTMTQPGVS